MPTRRFLLLAIPALLAACSGEDARDDSLSVAATAVPHAEILDFVKPRLAKQGVELEIRVFNDYVQPNMQVEQGAIDVNYFQTKPYLDEFNRTNGTSLQTIAGVHVEPFGAYSSRHKTLAALPDGAAVALPSEPSNTGRALLLLQEAGLIRLKDPNSAVATLRDVAANPRRLRFRELEAAMLPRVLNEVDLALINTNYALDAKLDPTRDALAIEGRDSPYVNFLVGQPDDAKDTRVQKLAAELRSPAVRQFIEQRYRGAVLPAF